MNLIVISLLAVASMSLLPSHVDGGAPSTDVKAPAALAATVGEIWQEDDREVLIRNVRGAAKNKDAQTGSTSGKKGGGGKNRKGHRHNGAARAGGAKEPNANRGMHKGPKSKQNENTFPLNQTENRSCRYAKSQWSECDSKTNQRTRTLTLKRGEQGCVQTRTIQKKCKKACRYEKGAWSECVAGKMNRVDKLRPNNPEANGAASAATPAVCESTRNVQKNCNAGKKAERKQKEKGGRRGRV